MIQESERGSFRTRNHSSDALGFRGGGLIRAFNTHVEILTFYCLSGKACVSRGVTSCQNLVLNGNLQLALCIH